MEKTRELLQTVLMETEEQSKKEFVDALSPFMEHTEYRPLLPVCNGKALTCAIRKERIATVPFQGMFLTDGKKPVARFSKATIQSR